MGKKKQQWWQVPSTQRPVVDVTAPGFKWRHPEVMDVVAEFFFKKRGGNLQEIFDALLAAGVEPDIACSAMTEFLDAVEYRQKQHNN